MNELPIWWLAVQAAGIAAFPLTFRLFRWLPDRGVTLVKVVGLLLLGYVFWMAAVLQVVPPSRGSVILALVAVAAVSWVSAGRLRGEVADFLRSSWRYILFVEVMFLVVLAAAVYLRSFAPEIDSGEKPFELAFLSAVTRAESFPPHDPWLAGEDISYYYFGYVIVAALTKLTLLQPHVTFFLGLSTVAALAWVAIFGLVYNLVRAARGRLHDPPRLSLRPVLFGVAAAILVLIVSNLEGVFELMARHGVGGEGFYGLVGVHGLEGPYDCASVPTDCEQWYPTRFYWWWWATRIGSPTDIQEFPFFSLHFGDLHAHVLVMPFLIALLALVFQTVLSARAEDADRRLDAGWLLRHPGRALVLVLLAGGIAFTDAWAVPLTLALVSAGVLLANWLNTGRAPLPTLLNSAGFLAPVFALSFVLYLPYYLDLEAQREGIGITQTAATPPGDPPENSESTRPLHFALFWSPLLLPLLVWAGITLRRSTDWLQDRGTLLLAALPAAVPLLVWTVWAVANDGPGALPDEASERAEDLLTLAFLAVAVTGAAFFFLRALSRRDIDLPGAFAWMLVAFALLMLYGAELFYVRDAFDWRANTVFRFWHEAWILLGLAGAFVLYRATEHWRVPQQRLGRVPARHIAVGAVVAGLGYTTFVALDPWDTLYDHWFTATAGLCLAGAAAVWFASAPALHDRTLSGAWRRVSWVAVVAVVFAAALVYPVLVTFDRTGGFTNDQTLDGLDFVTRTAPDEREAIDWLNENVDGAPVIAEAFGPDFSGFARVSSRTGLPTVIGWLDHERQWRGDPDPGSATPFTVRPQEVARLYNTPVPDEARLFIDKYDIKYVYVGSLERLVYNLDGLVKFREFMDIVFENEGVTIYRVRDDVASPTRVGD